MRGKVESLTIDVEGKQRITFALSQDARGEYEALKDKPDLVIEVKPYRKRRSLDANAYLWVLLGKLAEVLHTNKDEVYLIMLERYGVYTHLIVKPHVVDRIKQEWRTVRELGEVTVNGQTGIQLQCYFGSSTYNTKEMAVLLDGVVSEAKEHGIETATPDELANMKSRWANEKAAH
jgi:hypothetical protein